jgi:hypothetical protein
MSINTVLIDGVAQHLALRYDEHSRPELRLPAIGDSGSRGKLILWHELGRGTIREYEGTTRQN